MKRPLILLSMPSATLHWKNYRHLSIINAPGWSMEENDTQPIKSKQDSVHCWLLQGLDRGHVILLEVIVGFLWKGNWRASFFWQVRGPALHQVSFWPSCIFCNRHHDKTLAALLCTRLLLQHLQYTKNKMPIQLWFKQTLAYNYEYGCHK